MTNTNKNTTQVKKMEYSRHAALKKDIEIYFSKIIKKSFKDYFEKNYIFEFSVDFQSHRLISELLKKHGFKVYGMNVNMDGFQLLLDFSHDYLSVDNFPFTRLAVDFNNNGNYSVYLGESSFDDDWSVHLEDEFNRFRTLSEPEFISTLNEIKNTHLMLKLKG
jgi:hypothetical protein